MATKFLPNGMRPSFSFTSTLGAGSSWSSSVIDILKYQTFVGYCQANSSNVTVTFGQGGDGTTFEITSTQNIAEGVETLDWTTYAQYGRLTVAVNSTVGEALIVRVLGVPTT